MGRAWLIEHCVYEYNRKQERRAYQVYVTDSLKYINDSVISFFGGKSPSRRFADALKQANEQRPEETRTAEEIVSSISEKLERLKDDESI